MFSSVLVNTFVKVTLYSSLHLLIEHLQDQVDAKAKNKSNKMESV